MDPNYPSLQRIAKDQRAKLRFNVERTADDKAAWFKENGMSAVRPHREVAGAPPSYIPADAPSEEEEDDNIAVDKSIPDDIWPNYENTSRLVFLAVNDPYCREGEDPLEPFHN